MSSGGLGRGLLMSVASLLIQGSGVTAVRAKLGGMFDDSGSQVLLPVAWLQVTFGSSDAGGSLVGPLAYIACVLGTISIVVFLYWSRSVGEIFSIVVYLLALSTVRLSVKAVFLECGFIYPLAVSTVHFVVAALAAFGVLFYRSLSRGIAIPVPTRSEFLFGLLPIAACFSTCIGMGNQVLDLCSVPFAEVLGSTQPLISVPMVILLGMPFNMWLSLPTSLVVAGCAICSIGDMHFSWLGLVLAILSNVLRALKVAFQQKTLRASAEHGFDPVAILAWMSIPAAVLMLTWSLALEGPAPTLQLVGGRGSWNLVSSVLLSSVPATILNLSQLFVVAGLGAVGSQVVGQLKIALTILGSVVLLGEQVVPLQALGFAAIVVGTFFYSRWDQASKASAK